MLNFLYKIKRQLLSERFNGKKYMVGIPLKKDTKVDERDLKLGFNLFGYEPKNEVKVIKTLSIKDQHNNTCGQESYTVQAEVEEGCELSEQSQTCFMKKEGFIEQDGFSSLSENQKCGIKNGICEKAYLCKDEEQVGWNNYSSASNLTKQVIDNAILHKAKDFASCVGRSAKLKALDEGFVLHTGMDWYSGFNISGGFCSPWVINKNTGYLVGGHALAMVGYDMPRKVYIIQNSYSASWGGYKDSKGNIHAGCFAVDMDFFDKNGHASYERIDIDEHIDELIASYEGKDVKATGSGIFRIENGVKRPYPDSVTFFAFGGKYGKWGKTYVGIATSLLNKIPLGSDMNISDSPYFPMIKNNLPMLSVLSEPKNLEVIIQAIKFADEYSSKLNGIMKNTTKKYGVLSSSVNPQALSMTVKGILTTLLPFIAMILNLKGIVIDETAQASIISLAYDITLYGAMTVGLIISAIGGIRRWYQSIKK